MRNNWLSAGCVLLGLALPAVAAPSGDLLAIMKSELQRCQTQLAHRAPPGPYFMSYTVLDRESLNLAAMSGAMVVNSHSHRRGLEVETRCGSLALDNTHNMGGAAGGRQFDSDFPLDDTQTALRNAFYLPTEQAWRQASSQFSLVKTNQDLTVHTDDNSEDFSAEPPQQYSGPLLHLDTASANRAASLCQASTRFSHVPEIEVSLVSMQVETSNRYIANTDGTSLRFGDQHARVDVVAVAQADDGMQVTRVVSVQSPDVSHLPQGDALNGIVDQVVREVKAMRQAPLMEPYTGPAILSGRASAVFFHEIFGHRIEGHRQKGNESGQTFAHQVGEPVLPDFISVVDDPTRLTFGTTELAGAYLYDDEGVKSEPVTVVEHGVLRNFLMARSPVPGFSHSNGHGRRAPGFRAVGRQGNLIVEASQGYSDADLRARLIDLCKKQGKPFGIYIDDVNGGFTLTGRELPQAFEVKPALVYRVYVDGRPDTLVRGVSLIGTPLTSFSKIVACGDHSDVFNGTCGAESGPVPVSAVAPPMLLEQIELQKESQSDQRPPILPAPEETP